MTSKLTYPLCFSLKKAGQLNIDTVPIQSRADESCLFSSVSLEITGDNGYTQLLRAHTLAYMIEHYDSLESMFFENENYKTFFFASPPLLVAML